MTQQKVLQDPVARKFKPNNGEIFMVEGQLLQQFM